MPYHVHICCVGRNKDPVLAFTKSDLKVDRMYLLVSDNSGGSVSEEVLRDLKRTEDDVVETLDGLSVEHETVGIDSWDYESTIDAVLDIAAKESREHDDVRFYINVTSGTHVMTAAITSAAFFIGAELYYVINDREQQVTSDNRVRRFPIPNLPDVSKMKGLLKSALLIIASGSISNSELKRRLDLTSSHVGYYTGVLQKQGLICSNSHGTEKNWYATYSGKVAARILARKQE